LWICQWTETIVIFLTSCVPKTQRYWFTIYLPKETVGRVRAVLIEMLTNDNKEDDDKEDDDKEDDDKEDDDKEDDEKE